MARKLQNAGALIEAVAEIGRIGNGALGNEAPIRWDEKRTKKSDGATYRSAQEPCRELPKRGHERGKRNDTVLPLGERRSRAIAGPTTVVVTWLVRIEAVFRQCDRRAKPAQECVFVSPQCRAALAQRGFIDRLGEAI